MNGSNLFCIHNLIELFKFPLPADMSVDLDSLKISQVPANLKRLSLKRFLTGKRSHIPAVSWLSYFSQNIFIFLFNQKKKKEMLNYFEINLSIKYKIDAKFMNTQ